ncbi:TonB-dependent receptor [Stenotrophomonas sp. MH181796]|nr:TonB-dependent receptor [Stenotrophomonas maltophilia]MRI44577.1 TonB-dependent receptor [Stenotrophomonas sp. MH181796]
MAGQHRPALPHRAAPAPAPGYPARLGLRSGYARCVRAGGDIPDRPAQAGTGALRWTSLKSVENSNIGVANGKTLSHVSPHFGATYDLAPGIALFAGYSTAFRAPFGFIGLATPEPETSTNVEGA